MSTATPNPASSATPPFVFKNVGSDVTVLDFEDGIGGQDILDVSDFGFADAAALLAVASPSGPGGHDTLVQLDADDSILLKDFALANLDSSDLFIV